MFLWKPDYECHYVAPLILCWLAEMEQKQLKPFAFPQDVRLVVFGTKLFKVKVVFRGGQLR